MSESRVRWIGFVALLTLVAAASVAQENHWQEKNDAGNAAAQSGQYAAAEKLYREAIKEAEKFGAADMRLATSLANLATVDHLQGKLPEARDAYQRAIKVMERAQPQDTLVLAATLDRLATLYRDVTQFDKAEECAKRTVELRLAKLGEQHLDVAEAYENLALVYYLQGVLLRPAQRGTAAGSPFPEAAGDMSIGSRQSGINAAQQTGGHQAYSVTHPLSPEEQRNTLNALTAGKFQADLFPWGASATIDKGKLSKAAGNYRQSLDIREKLLGTAHPLVAKALGSLCEVLMAQRDYATAAPLYLQLSAIEERIFGTTDLRRVMTLRRYSYALMQMKQNHAAVQVDAQIEQILANNRKP